MLPYILSCLQKMLWTKRNISLYWYCVLWITQSLLKSKVFVNINLFLSVGGRIWRGNYWNVYANTKFYGANILTFVFESPWFLVLHQLRRVCFSVGSVCYCLLCWFCIKKEGRIYIFCFLPVVLFIHQVCFSVSCQNLDISAVRISAF